MYPIYDPWVCVHDGRSRIGIDNCIALGTDCSLTKTLDVLTSQNILCNLQVSRLCASRLVSSMPKLPHISAGDIPRQRLESTNLS